MKKIGIELEAQLVDKEEKMLEPSKYNFKYRDETDEMGFLVEIRVPPSDNRKELFANAFKEVALVDYKAREKGLKILFDSHVICDKEWIDDIARKYNIYDFDCFTKNVYGYAESHHLGIFPRDDKTVLTTAGLHIHLGSEKGFTTEQVENIVKKFDKKRPSYIKEAKRVRGEYENKVVEGNLIKRFEYRSYPNKAKGMTLEEYLFDIIDISFKIYRQFEE